MRSLKRMRSPNRPALPGKCEGYLFLAADGCPTLKVPVTSADAAASLFARYRDHCGIGASGMKEGCGNIYTHEGTIVARVSYNGRIWTADSILLQEPPQ
jgi:hypothetical protein